MALLSANGARCEAPRHKLCKLLGQYLILIALLIVAAWGQPNPTDKSPPPATVDEVKMQYLVRLGNFIDWPSSVLVEQNAFVLAIFSPNPFGLRLDDLAKDRKIHGLPITIRTIRHPADLEGCQMVFVPADADVHWRALLGNLAARRIVIVGEDSLVIDHYAVIGFYLDGDTVRLEASTQRAEATGVVLSSQLLRLARIIPAEPR